MLKFFSTEISAIVCTVRSCSAEQPLLTRGWVRDEIGLGPFSSSVPNAAQQECCEPGSILLCMGLFSRFFV